MTQHIETDTLFSRSMPLHMWRILHQGSPMTYVPDAPQGNTRQEIVVKADTAGHACDFICSTRGISRLNLTAEAV